MYITRDNRVYKLLEDELFTAYQEQLGIFFEDEARIQILDLITPDSVGQVPAVDLESFISSIASSGLAEYHHVDNGRAEAVKLAITKYLTDHDYHLPFECEIKITTDFF